MESNTIVKSEYWNGVIEKSEKSQADRIDAIAEHLLKNKGTIRLVLIGGPSSAGKTTFAKRLARHLEWIGAETLAISTDDYFVGDAKNPRDADGNLDYEHLNAIDLEQLNDNLSGLLAGRTVSMPRFDFTKHAPAAERHEEKLGHDAFAIIEGLHSLNPELTPAIPADAKYVILADTATDPYAIAANGAQDAIPGGRRLVRRIIRDAQYRGRNAEDTILRWKSVLAGEERWIRPFTCNAAEIFDSSLPYEPAVLRQFAAPALSAIKSDSPSHSVASSLLELLSAFEPLDSASIPPYSILREYIGGSCIHY